MRKYSFFRFVLHMIPALLGWAGLMLALWGLVFLNINDAKPQNKLTVYIDAEIVSPTELMVKLEDLSGISGVGEYIFDGADILKIKARSESYSLMNSSAEADADIFILAENDMASMISQLSDLPRELWDLGETFEYDGTIYGVSVSLPDDGNILFDASQKYYLCFCSGSLHTGQTDTAAFTLAKLLLDGIQ